MTRPRLSTRGSLRTLITRSPTSTESSRPTMDGPERRSGTRLGGVTGTPTIGGGSGTDATRPEAGGVVARGGSSPGVVSAGAGVDGTLTWGAGAGVGAGRGVAGGGVLGADATRGGVGAGVFAAGALTAGVLVLGGGADAAGDAGAAAVAGGGGADDSEDGGPLIDGAVSRGPGSDDSATRALAVDSPSDSGVGCVDVAGSGAGTRAGSTRAARARRDENRPPAM
jgi:hypothetical protein